MNRRPIVLALLAVALAAGACSDDPAPAEIRLSPLALSFDALGDTATITATVIDEDGREMKGRTVEWSTGDPGVARVDAMGRITSVGAGVASIVAASGKASASLAATVTPAVSRIQALSTPSQSGVAGDPLPDPVRVEARDRLGNPLPGVGLEAIVDEGGGSVSAATLITDGTGQASVTWTLGPQAGTVQQLRIRSTTQPSVATFFLAAADPGPAALLTVLSGDGQVGLAGALLPDPVLVEVTDRLGNPRIEEAVSVSVASGGGSVNATTLVSDGDGRAQFQWTLGANAGEQVVRVTAASLIRDLTATAVTDPTALRVLQGSSVTGVVGEAVLEPMVVRIEDVAGSGVAGVPLRFRVISGGGTVAETSGGEPLQEILVTTDAQGVASPGEWILGPGVGAQELEASFPGLEPVTLVADAGPGPAAGLAVESGGFQAGAVQTQLADPVRVQVQDQFGNPVPGQPVDMQVESGGGSVTVTLGTSGPDGVVTGEWTLGPTLGLQSLVATAPGLEPLAVYAAGVRPSPDAFHVDFRFLVPVAPDIWAAFQLAANRWTRVIVEDLRDVTANVAPSGCGTGSPAVQQVVDDVLVLARIESIDGAGGTLGSAGPCWIRGESSLPFLGRMRLDVDDLIRMQERGTLVDVITHEIGHILGVGTLWNLLGLLQDPSLDIPGSDTYFSGSAAQEAFDAVGGTNYTGAKVPVENSQGGQGTQDVHWRESVMDEELMTGYIDNIGNPLSIVTAASLEDLGYVVDLLSADTYLLAPVLTPGRLREKILLENDVLWLPLRRESGGARR